MDLPVPPGAVLSLLSDGTYAMSSLVRSVTACDLQVQLAAPDETSWNAPLPSTADPLPLEMCSLRDVSYEGRNLYHYFSAPGQGHRDDRMIRLTWRGEGAPRLEDANF